MRKLSAVVENGLRAVKDLDLLKVLQSEIRHELSNNPFQAGSLFFPPALMILYSHIFYSLIYLLPFFFFFHYTYLVLERFMGL